MLDPLPKVKKALSYRLLTQPPPAEISAAFLEILLAKNGVFARGRRAGLEVAVPVAQVRLPGILYELQPYLKLEYPKPDASLLWQMLGMARQSYDQKTGQPLEILFYLYWAQTKRAWQLHLPQQEQTPYSVRPLLTSDQDKEIYAKTVIELHTHPVGKAFFSPIDNQDEGSGFRLYGCLADIFGQPQIRMRVGLHGYFWEFRADLLWELGAMFTDALSQTEKGDQANDGFTS